MVIGVKDVWKLVWVKEIKYTRLVERERVINIHLFIMYVSALVCVSSFSMFKGKFKGKTQNLFTLYFITTKLSVHK